MQVFELNLDGLVGPSHHYAGLALGNIASKQNAYRLANPLAAALQGINKMRLLHRLGLKQALLPPHPRPNLKLLHQLGFQGTPEKQIHEAKKKAPELLSACYSAASMWTANAATISASTDTDDHKVHFTPANLLTNIHRAQEADFTHPLFRQLFNDPRYFVHHSPLPCTMATSDEGAANHIRLCGQHKNSGVNLFVYGQQALPANNTFPKPQRFPARQTLEASQAVARQHQLNHATTLFACQNPAAIDQGVFHNDVISVANESVFLVHQHAFLDQETLLQQLQNRANFPLHMIEISAKQLSIAEAVGSYLFNSQLITLPSHTNSQTMRLVSPIECQQIPHIRALLEDIISDTTNPIVGVDYLDLKQSMQNGGGPACLRLRVVLNELEINAMHQGILVTETLLDRLEIWVKQHYRTELCKDDLADPLLIHECFHALDELTNMLHLGSIYPFQHDSMLTNTREGT